MSFKREGNDKSWLNLLRKRRVSELHSVDIPENEAFLMKNGRFACMVCPHRPTFDTVPMLHIHRCGKKHVPAQQYTTSEVNFPSSEASRYGPYKRKYFSTGKGYDERKHGKNVTKESTKQNTKQKDLLDKLINESNELAEQNDAKAKILNIKPYKSKQNVCSTSGNINPDVSLANSNCAVSLTNDKSNAVVSQRSSTFQQNSKYKNNKSIFCWNDTGIDEDENVGDHICTRGLNNANVPKIYNSTRGNNLIYDKYNNNCNKPNNNTCSGDISKFNAYELADNHCENSKYINNKDDDSVIRTNILTPTQKADYLKAVRTGWVRTKEGGWKMDEGVEFDTDDDDEPPQFN